MRPEDKCRVCTHDRDSHTHFHDRTYCICGSCPSFKRRWRLWFW